MKDNMIVSEPIILHNIIEEKYDSLASGMKDQIKAHQEKLEQAYLENDIWFN